MNNFNEAYKDRKMLFGYNATEELMYVIKRFGVKGHALELGCGDGRDTYHMLINQFTIDAIDGSANAINNLLMREDIKEFLPHHLNAYVEDIQKMILPTKKYDFVYGITILDHIESVFHKKIIDNIFDSLKEGGFLFLKVHTVDDDGYINKETASEFSGQIKHFFNRNEMLDLFKNHGTITFYQEFSEEDLDHGQPHRHSFASILIKK
ncbi:class I SAM-dependent methyltransferase [Dysgonomonas sp. 521]|uniref:class I SAM-dependent methyltransferase n=1 Tax=Dysgonomonas sp. 521 TaxID=2302932 RepID=UPI0013D0A1BB|nr:class I SAM-dependent methyltransferase [Dysgonomonas sp. 521]NDV96786.1 class I SAM-dependent methyltransferase [Dysgonomonas sp. 521]